MILSETSPGGSGQETDASRLFKGGVSTPRAISRCSCKAPDYPEAARRAIREMHRQVGPLVTDEQGVALRGVLLRHLVMHGGAAGTPEIMLWIAQKLGPETYVNLMAQYRPFCHVTAKQYPEINRCITAQEFQQARDAFLAAGLRRLDHDSAATPVDWSQ